MFACAKSGAQAMITAAAVAMSGRPDAAREQSIAEVRRASPVAAAEHRRTYGPGASPWKVARRNAIARRCARRNKRSGWKGEAKARKAR